MPDVNAPVTHGELRQELSTFKTELKTELKTERFDAIDERFTAIDERFDAVDRRFDAVDRRFDALEPHLVAMEARLMAGLGRHTRASAEDLATRVTVVDDKYTDLPRRVARLEEAVFTPQPAPRRRAPRRGRAR